MHLFSLSAEVRALLDTVDETGELDEHVLARLDQLTPLAEDKVDTYAGIIEECQRRIAGRKATLDRLKAANQSDEKTIDRLKDALLAWMTTTGQRKLKTPLHSVSVCQSPPSATCTVNPSELGDDFQRIRVEANLAAAVEWWKTMGEAPPGFEIEQREHVRLR